MVVAGCSSDDEEKLPPYTLLQTKIYSAYTKYVFSYPSLDTQNRQIVVSGCVCVPSGWELLKPSHIVLYNHITLLSDDERPTNSPAIVPALLADNCVVVEADCDGYGVAVDRPLTPLSLKACGRQSADCLLAAFTLLEDKGITLDRNYFTWNVGASLGGGVALAVHRYIENEMSPQDAAKIRLKWSYCGCGIYKPEALAEQLVTGGTFGYLRAMPLFISGLISDFPDYFKGFSIRDFFQPYVFESGFFDKVISKDYNSLEVKDLYNKIFSDSDDPRDFFSDAIFQRDSREYHSLFRALQANNLLDGWQPHNARIAFFHSTNDNVIPYSNALSAYESLSSTGMVAPIRQPLLNPTHVPSTVLFCTEVALRGEKSLYEEIFPAAP